MSIVNRRNAMLGWLTWTAAKQIAARRLAQPRTPTKASRAKRLISSRCSRPQARSIFFWRHKRDDGGLAGRASRVSAVPEGPAEIPDDFVNPAVAGLTPYEPGKPVDEVQRELGLDRVVKLASNEGPFPPFPAALEAMERAARELNRYPDGGATGCALHSRNAGTTWRSRRSRSAPARTE